MSDFKITDKSGIKLKTANKYVTEDLGVTLTDNDINNIVAENIKSGISILGVSGTLEGAKEEETKTLALSMASGNQVITPTSGKVMNKVTITKPSTLIPENIKNGIDIGGVTGTYTGSGGSGSLDWVGLDYKDCSFDNESVFLSPEVSQLLYDDLTSSDERMIIIRFVGTFLDEDLGERTEKIMIAFSQTTNNIGITPAAGGAVKRGYSSYDTSNPYDIEFDTTNGTSIKISQLSAPSDFSNPNIISLDYVAIDI